MQPPLRVNDSLRGLFGLGALLAALALLISAVVLLGWAVRLPALYTFGFGPYTTRPLSALGYAMLAVAQLLALFGQRRAAVVLIAVPVLIGAVALAENILGVSLGANFLLFPNAVREVGGRFPGRPGATPAVGLMAIGVATWAALLARRWADPLILGLCAAVMGACWISLGLLLSGFAPEVGGRPAALATALPAAIAMLALASAVLAYRAAADPDGLFGPHTPSGRAIRLALPLAVLLPAVLLPIESLLVAHALVTPFSANVMTITTQLVLAVVLISLGAQRIAKDQAALAESEGRLGHALEAHGIGLFDWQIKSDRLRWSAGAEERMGLAAGTLTNRETWMRLVPPEDAEAMLARVADAAARKLDRYEFRYRMRRADGDLRTIEGSSRCFYDSHGELERIAGVNLDITDQIRREADIARREAQWLSILRTVPSAMIVIDRQGVVKTFSAAAETMFGYPADAVVGRNAMLLLPAADARVAAAQLALGMAPGGAHIGADNVVTGQRQDGSQFPAEYSVGEAMIDGEPIFTLFIRDISDRQAADSRFAALQQEYTHSARLNAVGEMASGLAHELNQPLAAGANFLGTAEVLLDDAENIASAREMVGLASAQLLRAGEIIRRLRDFIAKADVDMRVEPVAEMLREAVALALVGARQQQIEVGYALDADDAAVFVDRIQIQQVVVNLVRNAAQALQTLPIDRRRITIATRAIDADTLEVSIADRGRGLPPEILEQLFAPFRSTKSGEGLGIGLSICRRIIEAHGGRLDAVNLAEGGARISFTLARVSEEQGVGDQCVTSMS